MITNTALHSRTHLLCEQLNLLPWASSKSVCYSCVSRPALDRCVLETDASHHSVQCQKQLFNRCYMVPGLNSSKTFYSRSILVIQRKPTWHMRESIYLERTAAPQNLPEQMRTLPSGRTQEGHAEIVKPWMSDPGDPEWWVHLTTIYDFQFSPAFSLLLACVRKTHFCILWLGKSRLRAVIWRCLDLWKVGKRKRSPVGGLEGLMQASENFQISTL